MSGIIFCLQRGYGWADVPSEYGPAKTLYNRYKRWSGAGVFERIFNTLAHKDTDFQALMLDEPHVKTHRVAANWVKKNTGDGRAIWLIKGGLNSKLHLVCDSRGRPFTSRFLLQ